MKKNPLEAIPEKILIFAYSGSCCRLLLSRVQLFCNPMHYSPQAPLFTVFPRQEHWSGLPFPPLGGLNPGIEPTSPAFAGGFLYH